MVKNLRIPALLGGSLLFIWWAFFTHVQNDTEEDLYSIEAFQEDTSSVYSHLGKLALSRGNLAQAIKSFQETVAIRRDWLEGYEQLGIAQELNGQPDQAMKTYAHAMAVNPNFIEYRFCNGTRIKATPSPDIAQLQSGEPWTGQDLTGKKIFVYSEKGLGDTIMFCRFLPLLAEQAAKVYFKPHDLLVGLMRAANIGPISIYTKYSNLSQLDVDYHVSLLSLQHYLDVNLSDIAATKPYLKANPDKVLDWNKRLAGGNNFKIGIYWQGEPNHMNDKNRSVPLEIFYPLCRLKGVKIYSLQKGFGIEQLDNLPKDLHITDVGSEIRDFTDTAAIVTCLDLVITIDTALVHLAGALGKEVWMLTPYVTDWRWLGYAEKTSSVWYPQLYKLRQPYNRSWDRAMAHAVEKLQLRLKK